jgi:hypothetical protein
VNARTPARSQNPFEGEKVMKSHRFWLVVAIVSLTAVAFAQSTATPAVQSDAQKSFDKIKSLAGSWEGTAKMDPPMDGASTAAIHVSMRITSRGNALVHEMQAAGTPEDPTKYDHPVTMFYLDSDRLVLTHYCDAGNRPRMAARTSADGKTIEFDYLDVAGDVTYGHMQHAVFTMIDANHHSEEWTFLMPGDKLMHGHMDLVRTK